MASVFSWSIAPSLPWVTTLFIACIFLLWAYFFFFKFTPTTVANAPAVLTSLGIFATFVGVASGLSGFDTGDVQGSIPALLDGLKTAFWSSIAGIGGAVLIKLKHLVRARRSDEDEAAGGATIDDLANLLRELNTNDRLDALKRSLDGFLANAAENNSQALANALHEVIRDFNVKLNEQFGENFKRLNEAAEKILVWGDRYNGLVDKAEAFSGIAEEIGNLSSGLDRQREQVQEATASLVDIADYCRTWNFITPTTQGPSFEGKRSELRKERTHPADQGTASARDK
jgi:hypothetical protein